MTKSKILSAGVVAAAMLATPVMAQQVNQEPGVMGYNYPNSRYLTGGYGVRGTPGPGYYYWNQYHAIPRVGPYAVIPRPGPFPRVGAFATAPWDDSYAYYGEPETVWVAPY